MVNRSRSVGTGCSSLWESLHNMDNCWTWMLWAHADNAPSTPKCKWSSPRMFFKAQWWCLDHSLLHVSGALSFFSLSITASASSAVIPICSSLSSCCDSSLCTRLMVIWLLAVSLYYPFKVIYSPLYHPVLFLHNFTYILTTVPSVFCSFTACAPRLRISFHTAVLAFPHSTIISQHCLLPHTSIACLHASTETSAFSVLPPPTLVLPLDVLV